MNKRAEKQQAVQAVAALESYLYDVEGGEDPEEYQEKIRKIVQTPPSKRYSLKDEGCDEFMNEWLRLKEGEEPSDEDSSDDTKAATDNL